MFRKKSCQRNNRFHNHQFHFLKTQIRIKIPNKRALNNMEEIKMINLMMMKVRLPIPQHTRLRRNMVTLIIKTIRRRQLLQNIRFPITQPMSTSLRKPRWKNQRSITSISLIIRRVTPITSDQSQPILLRDINIKGKSTKANRRKNHYWSRPWIRCITKLLQNGCSMLPRSRE